MAYTIVKSDGQVLTTIADGTLNANSTSLSLPGRNYAGYGQYLDTNFVHVTENFADTTPPANPLRGQLWFNTNANTLCVCPADGTSNANAWLTLAQSGSAGTTTFGAVQVSGNLTSNNITVTNGITADTITVRLATVTANATIANAGITNASIGTTTTQTITTGGATTAGALTGTWTVTGGLGGSTMLLQNGNLIISNSGNFGIATDNYRYANGTPISFAGTYNDSNVSDYLTGSNSVTRFSGAIAVSSVTTANLTTGASGTAGQITGNWSLSSGSRLIATYADLAERYEADAVYEPGTVVELGGEKEVTAASELSEQILGVVSNTAAYLMNGAAGTDETHPAIALVGRLQVKVIGKVAKHDRLVSAGGGLARAATKEELTLFNVVGRSLSNKLDDAVGTVEAVVSVTK